MVVVLTTRHEYGQPRLKNRDYCRFSCFMLSSKIHCVVNEVYCNEWLLHLTLTPKTKVIAFKQLFHS